MEGCDAGRKLDVGESEAIGWVEPVGARYGFMSAGRVDDCERIANDLGDVAISERFESRR